jgi:predicted DNA-binding protein YlxM (UPF0122 family)
MDREIIHKKSRAEWEHLIHQHVFDEIGRKILERNLLDGVPYERIAEELDISRATVFNKFKKCFDRLLSHCD